MNCNTATHVAIFGNSRQEEHISALDSFLNRLMNLNIGMSIEKCFARYLVSKGIYPADAVMVDELPEDVGIVVSIGGDGTFLRAADWVGRRGVPVMGINTGHLGYLAGFSLERPEEAILAIEGEYERTPRMLLAIECDGMPWGFRPFALNEIAISKGDTTSMVKIRAEIDGHYLTSYLADGLIISTPTGSTAYNLSCGGPILQPTVKSVILTPIAPHSLTLRPIVIDADSTMVFRATSRGEEIHVGVDGRTFALPSNGIEIRIHRAPFTLNVAQPRCSDFSSVLRTKLGWGS